MQRWVRLNLRARQHRGRHQAAVALAAWRTALRRSRAAAALAAVHRGNVAAAAVRGWRLQAQHCAAELVAQARGARAHIALLRRRTLRAWHRAAVENRRALQHGLWAAQHAARGCQRRAFWTWRGRTVRERARAARAASGHAELLSRAFHAWAAALALCRCASFTAPSVPSSAPSWTRFCGASRGVCSRPSVVCVI